MKLQLKLVLLVAGAAALFLTSILAYFALLAPLDAIQKEVGVFQTLSRSAATLQVESNLLVIKTIGPQKEVFLKAVDAFHAAQKLMSSVVLLPQVNEEVAAAVSAVVNLGELSESSLESVSDALDQIETQFPKENATAEWTALMRLAATGEVANQGSAMYVLSNLTSVLTMLNETLTVTRRVVEQKDGDINSEIAKLKAQGTLVGLGIILLSVALAIFLSFLLARNITLALSKLGSTVALVGRGDLRLRFKSRRKDELGMLSGDIDAFLDSLTSAFRRIQAASTENIEVKDQLVNSVATANSSAVQIEANSTSILGQLEKADDRIQGAQTDLNGVVDLMEAFQVRLNAQSQGVSDATSSVGELAQGVSRISELSDQNRHAVEALLAESERGREVFDRSFAKVAEINESVEAIQDLVGAIAGIAGQTNILSLNAAIEAAHAGEAGRGFAVVADEISKLAAESAATSAQIASTIQDVVKKIREAGGTREETLGAFDSIGTQITKVSEQGRGIYDETTRMNEGTSRIRQVMQTLSVFSEETTQEADRINSVATKVGDVLGQVGRISHEVVSNIGEITSGLGEISRTVTEVSAQADRLGKVGDDLDKAVNAFQTEEGIS